MVKAVARTVTALLLAAVVCLAVSPLLWTAGAQTQTRLGQAPGATTSIFVFPTATVTTPATTAGNSTTTRRPATTFKPRTPTVPPGSTTSTVAATLPPTTVAPIPSVAPAPVTLPLATARQSGHVSALFPILGGIGILGFIALLTTQWFLTDPRRRGPTL